MEIVRLIVLLAVFIVVGRYAIYHMIFPCRRSYTALDGVSFLPVDSGIKIAYLYLDNPDAEYTVLFSHGNYEDLGTLEDFLQQYYDKGFSVLAWDYRGYGISGGNPSESNLYSDIRKIFAHMNSEMGIPPEKIILHGRSVGTGPACDLASEVGCGGLVMESGFISIFSTKLPWAGLTGDKFVNIDKIDKVECKKLFIHGEKDRVVPFTHAIQLYEKSKEPKSSLWLKQAGHNDVLWLNEDEFWDSIVSFAKS